METEFVDPKRRKKTPPSSGEHDSLAPPVPTGPDAVATKQEDSVMASSSKEEPGTVIPRDTSGDVNMEATNSEPSGPVTSSLLSKVDLDYDYDPNEPKLEPEESTAAPMEVSGVPGVMPTVAEPPRPKRFRLLWKIHPQAPDDQRTSTSNDVLFEFVGTCKEYERMFSVIDTKHNGGRGKLIILASLRPTVNFEFMDDFIERVEQHGIVVNGKEELQNLVHEL